MAQRIALHALLHTLICIFKGRLNTCANLPVLSYTPSLSKIARAAGWYKKFARRAAFILLAGVFFGRPLRIDHAFIRRAVCRLRLPVATAACPPLGTLRYRHAPVLTRARLAGNRSLPAIACSAAFRRISPNFSSPASSSSRYRCDPDPAAGCKPFYRCWSKPPRNWHA